MFRQRNLTPVNEENIERIKDQQGLAVLYEPSGYIDPPSFSIILVHGIGGSLLKSWTAENGCCWPRDLLPKDIEQLYLNGRSGRVLSWGYNAKLASVISSNDHSTVTLHDQASCLFEDVNRYRHQKTNLNHKIIFIGHDIGGLIIQAALCESMISTDRTGRPDDLYENVAGIMFMGTPHLGFEMGRWASSMGSIFSGLSLGYKSPMWKTLKRNSEALQYVNIQFRRVLQRVPIRIWSVYETLKLPGGFLVPVDKSTATLGLAEERTLALDADHKHLNKFLDHNDNNYSRISGALQQLIREICEEDFSQERPMTEPAATIHSMEIEEGTRITEPPRTADHSDGLSVAVQDSGVTTIVPSKHQTRANDDSAIRLSRPFERTRSSNLTPSISTRSLGSNATDDGMKTISTVASSVSSASRSDSYSRSAAIGSSVVNGLETAVSTADSAASAPSTIISGVGAGLAGTALAVQGFTAVTARKALSTARNSATASQSSANTARDAFALNQAIFDYNRSKDQSALAPKPKPPSSSGPSQPSAGQVTELTDDMFPSLAGVSPTFDGPSKKKDDGDQDGDQNGGLGGDHHHPITRIEDQPNAEKRQDKKGKGKEKEKAIVTRVPKPRTLFDYGFKSKNSLSTPTPKILVSHKIRDTLVQNGCIANSITIGKIENQADGGEIVSDVPKTGSEEVLAESKISEQPTETSTEFDVLLTVASDASEGQNSDLDSAAINVQHEIARSSVVEESRPPEHDISITTDSALEPSTTGKNSELVLSPRSPTDETDNQGPISSIQSTLETTEVLPSPRLVESSTAVELAAITKAP